METIQQRFGKALLDYFLQRTSPNESFKLCIDTFTYEYCAKNAGLNEVEVEKLLAGKDFKKYNSYNDCYSILTIVALEIKIAYDIETSDNLRDCYNPRLIDKTESFSDLNDVQQFYREYQDKIWKKTKDLFAEYNRLLDIPEAKSGPWRYVQYPLSQVIITGTEIFKYADTFLRMHLEPNQSLSFSTFTKLIQFEDKHNSIEKKRIIFSFYGIWNGQKYAEIMGKGNIISHNSHSSVRDEIFIKLEHKIEVFFNKTVINLDAFEIPEKYLSKTDYNYFNKIAPFSLNSDYEVWQPCHSIHRNESFLLIMTSYSLFPGWIINNEDILIREEGEYSFILFNSLNRSYEKFGFSKYVTQEWCELVGGIKEFGNPNSFYSFSLPTIKLIEKIDSNGKEYNEIFFDSKPLPIKNNTLNIESLFNNTQKMFGEHVIKLWDTTIKYFKIIKAENNPLNTNLGWNLNYNLSILEPARQKEEIVIQGVTFKKKMEMLTNNILEEKLFGENNRCFISHKKKFERILRKRGIIKC